MFDFNLAIAGLFTSLGCEAFYATLLNFIYHEVPADSSVVLLYQRGASPQILLDAMTERDRAAMQVNYFAGAYLLSPFYLRWLANPLQDYLGRLEEITPEGFFESVYYHDYYGRSGLKDEMSYLIPVSTQSAILFSLGRSTNFHLFSETEKTYLKTIYPIIIQAAQRHASLVTLPTTTKLKVWLEDGVQLFGQSVLTEREQWVVRMMLQGHSSKSCAKVLDISPTTERVHRRNIYTKLHISSQAELFKLFFAAMSAENLAQGVDPLSTLSFQITRH